MASAWPTLPACNMQHAPVEWFLKRAFAHCRSALGWLMCEVVFCYICAVQRYCKDNPSRFHNADSAYMLSFSIIMLNTGRPRLNLRCTTRMP